ncbi:MAG TPA: hypothetical protein EYP32_03850 [Aquificaceae bacterium]|nr:hypothetical protein [Aquificaceae bacterium]HIQ48400.1 hypothetical protein [Aquifex aeolicus]
MVKGVLLILLFVALAFLFEVYVKKYKAIENVKIVKSEVLEVLISLYGNKGTEWIVKGEKLFYQLSNLVIKDPEIKSGSYRILAGSLHLNKYSKKGILENGVEIFGPDLYLRTLNAYIDFEENTAWGYQELLLRRGGNLIKGKGFKIFFKPFKVIIDEVKSIHSAP